MKLLLAVFSLVTAFSSFAADVTVAWNPKHSTSSGTAYVLNSRKGVNSQGYPSFNAHFGTASTVRFTPANLGGLNQPSSAQQLSIVSSGQAVAVNSSMGSVSVTVTNSFYPWVWTVSGLNNDGYAYLSPYGTGNCSGNSPIQFGTNNGPDYYAQPGTKPTCVQVTKGVSTNNQYVLSNCSCITRADQEI